MFTRTYTTHYFAKASIGCIGNIEVYQTTNGYILFDPYNNKVMCIT